jgi:ABC-2 type transport system permease protein
VDEMRSLKEYIRLYFIIEAQYIKARMQYRADFIISSVGMFFTSLATLGVFWVMFNSIPDLAGWNFMEMVFIYAFFMLAISPMQILFDHTWQLRFHVQQGTFLKYYFRPLNMMFYYMSEMFDIKGITQLLLGIGLLIYASIKLSISWTFLKLLLLLLSLFSASLVLIAIILIAGCTCFWVINSYPVLGLAVKLRDFAPYPMNIFDGAFRFAFTYVLPIGFIAFYPSQLFLRPQEVSPLLFFSPFIGIGLFILGYRVWLIGVNSYTGTGS